MLKVAITGTMGAGKSTVIQLFEKSGCKVLLSDEIVAELYENDKSLQTSIRDEFSIPLTEQKTVDKAALAALVFSDAKKLEKLEALVFPRVRDKIIESMSLSKDSVYFVELPLLFEADMAADYDFIIVVDAPVKIRLQRLREYRGITEDDALKRMNRQWSGHEKQKRADFIIYNDGNLTELELQVSQALDLIRRKVWKEEQN